MPPKQARALIALMIVSALLAEALCRSVGKKVSRAEQKRIDRLMVLQRRETTPVNFSRLVIMRLIYGVASMLGLQDRLGGVLNGIFVPPGADEDDYGFGLDDDDEGGFDAGDFFDI